MKKFAVVLALFAGVALGFSVVSSSFMTTVGDGTSGDLVSDLMIEYPGYIPLSLTSTQISAFYSLDSGDVVLSSPSGSGPILILELEVPPNMGALTYGLIYRIPVSVPYLSEVAVTVSSSSSSVCGESFVSGTFSSFKLSSSFVSSSGLGAVRSHVYVSALDGDGTRHFSSSYYFGSPSTYSFVADSTTDYLDLLLYVGSSNYAVSGSVALRFLTSLIDISIDVKTPNYDEWIPRIYNQTVSNGNYVQHISVNSDTIVSYLRDLSIASGTPSEMTKFEDAYIEAMSGQLSGVEHLISPENTALPNNGDFVGFVTDIQDGLGINGSSFNAARFGSALSEFGSSDAVGSGGPWEFFSQAVADSLSGDISLVGLADDDYIYVWLDEMRRRYGQWVSSSP